MLLRIKKKPAGKKASPKKKPTTFILLEDLEPNRVYWILQQGYDHFSGPVIWRTGHYIQQNWRELLKESAKLTHNSHLPEGYEGYKLLQIYPDHHLGLQPKWASPHKRKIRICLKSKPSRKLKVRLRK